MFIKNYTGFKSCVFIGSQQSSWFDVCLGVHQGAPLSTKMYIIFNNDLLENLCSMAIGPRLSGVEYPLVCPSFADDIAVIALHKPDMQLLLKVVYIHSTKWRYSFNPAKCHILVYGTDQCPGRQLTMGDSVISTRTIDTHPLIRCHRPLIQWHRPCASSWVSRNAFRQRIIRR